MHQMLTQLKLARIREIHQEWLDRAAAEQMPYPDFLRGLLQEELLAREDNQVRRRLKDAAFPDARLCGFCADSGRRTVTEGASSARAVRYSDTRLRAWARSRS